MQETQSTDDTDRTGSDDRSADVGLPRRTVDRSESLEDRLTDNIRLRAGPERYFAKDSEGDLLESDWGDVFSRVAKNVAIPEAVFHDTPIDIAHDSPAIADWVDQDTVIDLFDIDELDGQTGPQVEDGSGTYVFNMESVYRRLDEDLAPYLEYDGLIERVPDDVADRMAEAAQEFEDNMRTQQFMPNSPCLMNMGTELQQGSACFVDSPSDSIESINETDSEWMLIQKTGGGVGGAFHLLRPKGHPIASTGGWSSGPVSFMRKFDLVSGVIKQGGCVATDERVMTSSGYIPLGQVYDGPALGTTHGDDRVYTRGGDMNDVVESSDSGTMPAVTVRTQDGYDITVTGDHPLMVLDGGQLQFRRAGEIEKSDIVVLSAADKRPECRESLTGLPDEHHHNANVPGSVPDHVTDDLAKFLGILWGDGCISYDTTGNTGNRVILTLGNDGNGDSAAQELIEDFCTKHDISLRSKDKSGTEKGNYTRYEIASSPFVEWLDRNELAKDSDRLADIPEAIYRSPAAIPSFLGGLTVDGFFGGLTVDGSVSQDASTVTYTTADPDFASVIQDLLLAAGVPSRKYTVEDGDRWGTDTMHTVQVFPGHWAERYDETVPHLLDGSLGETSGEQQNTLGDPAVYERILDENFTKNHKLPEEADADAVKRLRRYARGERFTSLVRARSVFEDAGVSVDEYDVLDEENLFQSVESVEETGPVYVCDIENKTGKPEYVASNFVVHNKRRGAQMAIMHCAHPDIGRFAVAKRSEDEITNFNISVGFSEAFVEAVRADEPYELRWPVESDEPYEATRQTKHFYDPEFEDAWNEDFDKPGADDEGNVVEANFWRDHLDEMQDPESFEAYRDRIDINIGESLSLPAGFVFRMIVDGAHNNGEPGLFNYDETQHQHSFDVEQHPEHVMHGTNPCAEMPLQEYESCTLGHVNLSLMAAEDGPTWSSFTGDTEASGPTARARAFCDEALDNDRLSRITRGGARFLDSVLTMGKFPIEEIDDMAHEQRKIGLGIMGLHQLLMQLGVQYGSPDSEYVVREIMRRVDMHATEASHELAGERGKFPAFEKSKWDRLNEYPEWSLTHAHQEIEPEEIPGDNGRVSYPVRNHNQTTIAPTGTTSMIGDTSGGCEPIYNVAFYKNVGDDIQGGEMLVEFDDYFLRVLEENDIDTEAVKTEARQKMSTNDFDSVDDLETVPDGISKLFVTAGELSVTEHIRVQAACQDYIDSGISKTLNIRNEATIEEVGEAFLQALESGVKGATVYRDGSRNEQVKTTRATENKLDDKHGEHATDVLVELLDRGHVDIGALSILREEDAIDGDLLAEIAEETPVLDVQKPEEDSHPVGGDD